MKNNYIFVILLVIIYSCSTPPNDELYGEWIGKDDLYLKLMNDNKEPVFLQFQVGTGTVEQKDGILYLQNRTYGNELLQLKIVISNQDSLWLLPIDEITAKYYKKDPYSDNLYDTLKLYNRNYFQKQDFHFNKLVFIEYWNDTLKFDHFNLDEDGNLFLKHRIEEYAENEFHYMKLDSIKLSKLNQTIKQSGFEVQTARENYSQVRLKVYYNDGFVKTIGLGSFISHNNLDLYKQLRYLVRDARKLDERKTKNSLNEKI